MQPVVHREEATAGPKAKSPFDHLQHVIDHVAHLLPAQGPITVFIHHNTLHAFEDLPFEEAVKKGASRFGCQPFLTEDRYREELGRGRIRFSELQDVLRASLAERADERMAPGCTRLELRQAMLQYPLRTGPTEELCWFVAEKDALRRFRVEADAALRQRMMAETRHWVMRDLRRGGDPANGLHRPHEHPARTLLAPVFARFDERVIESWPTATWEAFTLQAMWRLCCEGVRGQPPFTPPAPAPVRHRDLLLKATGVDADLLVNGLLIRFCASFLDQGVGHWQLPRRDEGFYRCFCAMYRLSAGPPARWLAGLAQELVRLDDAHVGPLQSIHESLKVLGVPEAEWDEFIATTLLSLRGWAGMLCQVEARGDRVARPAPAGTLVEYVAVRLLLDRWALAYTARTELGFDGPLNALRDEASRLIGKPEVPSVEQRAFLVFQLAQLLGWTPENLFCLSTAEWNGLLEEIETFSGLERRRIFHLAYERRFQIQTLDALALHAQKTLPVVREPRGNIGTPRFQAVFCLDEREESMRRHLEEIAPDVETLGAAGFYSVAMYYRGAADAHFVPLCPVVIRPKHWVTEEVEGEHCKAHERRARTRRALGTASHQFHVGSRSVATGALLTTAVGVLASIPLVARILFPRLTARIRRLFGRIVQTPPSTRLQLERAEETAGPVNGQIGYSVEEMTDAAERLLREMGLTTRFARLVLLIGHGSNSLNNPHNSAYNCGACGGAAGGPNARAMAQVLGDPRVRQILENRGIDIPAETVFVGGYHNTCNDSVIFFDTDRVPATHRDEFEQARHNIHDTCQRNAHERCRRFMSASLTMSFAEAHRHVEERSEDLSQTRPECGHATNTICIVGKREWTRGLYLDRRCFLTSYDPLQDDADNTVLMRILGAVFPVCAGINLEYYFSYVDSPGYGCGTKLPHNVSALLGVMDGPASDLRTGLPWQMVEIHEPVRLVMLIEVKQENMLRIMSRNEGINRLCRNGWVYLCLVDPDTRQISVFENGRFRAYEPQATALPQASSSADWYRGWRDHLEFAQIGE
jgi:uncharacterized protein YbcC (UPF0753/DUF2309 family)